MKRVYYLNGKETTLDNILSYLEEELIYNGDTTVWENLGISFEDTDIEDDEDLKEEKNYETYYVYQTMQEFKELHIVCWDVVDTNDIEETLNDFCEEMGANYLYDIDTLTCYDDYGNEYKFVKAEKEGE